MDLRDFQSILYYFSEEEIKELQAAIDKRRGLALDKESLPEAVEQSDYSASGVEGIPSEVPLRHPA